MSEFEMPDVHVPHEAEVDEAIVDELGRLSGQGSIADVDARVTHSTIVDAGAPGVGYVQAEADAVRDQVVAMNAALAAAEATIDDLVAALNLALGVLRDANLIPTV